MTTLELKKMLVHKIAEIDDNEFLQAIKTILDAKAQTKTKTLNLTNEQLNEIQESKLDYGNGLFLDQAELDMEFNKWLKEK